jgi:A/G-specific adenine glycosylase
MLQQTQVSRVIEKFNLWMKRYPTLKKLRGADLKEILILWQGLGYQRRAKALLAIAKSTDTLVNDEASLLALPGVGVYTVSALRAFAFNSWSLMLETNIRTALIEKFHSCKKKVSDDVLKKDLEILINLKAVQKVGARLWYSALMDYGAHLKSQGISHNTRTKGYKKQSIYKGSFRKVRAEVLFAITHNEALPLDERVPLVVQELKEEGFIVGSTKEGWSIA